MSLSNHWIVGDGDTLLVAAFKWAMLFSVATRAAGLSCYSAWCFFGGRSRQAVDLSYQRLSISDPCMEVSGIVWSMTGLLHLDFLVLWVGWVEAASWGVDGRSSLHLGSSNAYVPGIIMAFFAW